MIQMNFLSCIVNRTNAVRFKEMNYNTASTNCCTRSLSSISVFCIDFTSIFLSVRYFCHSSQFHSIFLDILLMQYECVYILMYFFLKKIGIQSIPIFRLLSFREFNIPFVNKIKILFYLSLFIRLRITANNRFCLLPHIK